MFRLNGTKTPEHLVMAFARQSRTNRCSPWVIQRADVEGRPAATVFISITEGETGHALDLLAFLAEVGDPVTDEPIGDTDDNLSAVLAGEMHDATDLYPGLATVAREEGLGEAADWFGSPARGEAQQADRLRRALDEHG